jgi:hypothetical protein
MSISAKQAIRRVKESRAGLPSAPWEPWMQRLFNNIRSRFIEERAYGWTDKAGQVHPPMGTEAAIEAWQVQVNSMKKRIQTDPKIREQHAERLSRPGSSPLKPHKFT